MLNEHYKKRLLDAYSNSIRAYQRKRLLELCTLYSAIVDKNASIENLRALLIDTYEKKIDQSDVEVLTDLFEMLEEAESNDDDYNDGCGGC